MWQFGWMLSLIPDSIFIWIYYLMLTIGIGLYVASKLVRWIPLMGQYKFPAELIGVILLVAGAYFYGGHGVNAMWQARVKELEDKVKIAEAKSQEKNIEIKTVYVDKVKYIDRVRTVVQEKIKQDAAKIDAQCVVAPEAIADLNEAAEMKPAGEKK